MRPRVVGLGALGTLVTVLAAALLLVPDLARDGPLAGAAAALGGVDERRLLLAASLLLGAVVTALTWRATRTAPPDRDADAFDETVAAPPEAVTTDRQRLTAAGLDAEIDAAVAGDEGAADAVEERLRDLAATAYARSAGVGPDAARAAVADGTWTDDATAAATLAGPEGPNHSVPERLRLWLDPESERERRYRRVVAAAADLAGGVR